jgi:hypothetical protein
MNKPNLPDFFLPQARPVTHDDHLNGRSKVPHVPTWALLALMLANCLIFAYAYFAL